MSQWNPASPSRNSMAIFENDLGRQSFLAEISGKEFHLEVFAWFSLLMVCHGSPHLKCSKCFLVTKPFSRLSVACDSKDGWFASWMPFASWKPFGRSASPWKPFKWKRTFRLQKANDLGRQIRLIKTKFPQTTDVLSTLVHLTPLCKNRWCRMRSLCVRLSEHYFSGKTITPKKLIVDTWKRSSSNGERRLLKTFFGDYVHFWRCTSPVKGRSPKVPNIHLWNVPWSPLKQPCSKIDLEKPILECRSQRVQCVRALKPKVVNREQSLKILSQITLWWFGLVDSLLRRDFKESVSNLGSSSRASQQRWNFRQSALLGQFSMAAENVSNESISREIILSKHFSKSTFHGSLLFIDDLCF